MITVEPFKSALILALTKCLQLENQVVSNLPLLITIAEKESCRVTFHRSIFNCSKALGTFVSSHVTFSSLVNDFQRPDPGDLESLS